MNTSGQNVITHPGHSPHVGLPAEATLWQPDPADTGIPTLLPTPELIAAAPEQQNMFKRIGNTMVDATVKLARGARDLLKSGYGELPSPKRRVITAVGTAALLGGGAYLAAKYGTPHPTGNIFQNAADSTPSEQHHPSYLTAGIVYGTLIGVSPFAVGYGLHRRRIHHTRHERHEAAHAAVAQDADYLIAGRLAHALTAHNATGVAPGVSIDSVTGAVTNNDTLSLVKRPTFTTVGTPYASKRPATPQLYEELVQQGRIKPGGKHSGSHRGNHRSWWRRHRP